MAEKTYNQEFNGYRREPNIKSLSNEPGVYGVYRCKYNEKGKTVTLIQLLYIGKADDLNKRINNHEDWDVWRRKLKSGEQICFCYSFVDKSNNERVEAALINSNQPPLNIEYKDSFPYDKTTVNCTGNHEFIKKKNVVNRK
ncbi:GIY-YIG nuclease family protein [Ekhidna sp.]|uniref:GIY-YIG nuclease family protein n=1 Tax=Ekhidna sp. TaxID=2608089 RepID=UPI0035116C43